MERLRSNDLVGGKHYKMVVPGDKMVVPGSDAPEEISIEYLGFFGWYNDPSTPAVFLYAQPEGKIAGMLVDPDAIDNGEIGIFDT